jgi:hypothetical protein
VLLHVHALLSGLGKYVYVNVIEQKEEITHCPEKLENTGSGFLFIEKKERKLTNDFTKII